MAPDPLSPFRIADLTADGFGRDKFLSLRREMNSLFDDVFSGHMPSTERGEGPTLMPQIDVSETERELKIDAELPGLSDNEIEVRLENDVLVIRAEKKFERKDEKKNYHLIERSYGTFQRALRLPGPVDMDQVQVRLEHGVLTVIVPKSQQQERSRRIKIQGQKPEPGQLEGERGIGAKGFRAASPLAGC
jgi:HSP20 family protein